LTTDKTVEVRVNCMTGETCLSTNLNWLCLSADISEMINVSYLHTDWPVCCRCTWNPCLPLLNFLYLVQSNHLPSGLRRMMNVRVNWLGEWYFKLCGRCVLLPFSKWSQFCDGELVTGEHHSHLLQKRY